MTLMIDPRHIWNAIYTAWSNRTHPPTSPNIAPATKNDVPKSEQKSSETDEASFTWRTLRAWSQNDPSRIREWSEHELVISHPPVCLRLTFRALEMHFVVENSTFRIPAISQSFTACCACHKKWDSNITKYCTCHEKWFEWQAIRDVWLGDVSDVTWLMGDVGWLVSVMWDGSDVWCERCVMWAMCDVSDVLWLTGDVGWLVWVMWVMCGVVKCRGFKTR